MAGYPSYLDLSRTTALFLPTLLPALVNGVVTKEGLDPNSVSPDLS